MMQQKHPLPRTTDIEISPPPLKRRRLTQQPNQASDVLHVKPSSTGTMGQLMKNKFRIFSWNINGLSPFLTSMPSTRKMTPSLTEPASKPRIYVKNKSRLEEYFPSWQHWADSKNPTLLGAPYSLRALLSRHDWPEVVFLQELKVSPRSRNIRMKELTTALNNPLNTDDSVSDDRTYKLFSVTPRDIYNAKAFGMRMYGVATAIRKDFLNKWVAVFREVNWDTEGRVSVVEMRTTPKGQQGKGYNSHMKPLALINVYAVNGTDKSYFDPNSGNPHPTWRTRHDRKRAFHSLLRDECLTLEARGFNVVIVGDFNISRGPADGFPDLRSHPKVHCGHRADFNLKFFGEEDNKRAGAYLEPQDEKNKKNEKCLDAVDVFRAKYGLEPKYTFYSTAMEFGTKCDRVDMAICSKQLWEDRRVIDMQIFNTKEDRGPSDHVPMYVDIAL